RTRRVSSALLSKTRTTQTTIAHVRFIRDAANAAAADIPATDTSAYLGSSSGWENNEIANSSSGNRSSAEIPESGLSHTSRGRASSRRQSHADTNIASTSTLAATP